MNKLLASFFVAAALWLTAALPAEAASRFLICSTTCTITAADTALWSATSGGATGASVPGSSDTVTFDANTCVGGTTCTITFGSGYNPTWQTWTMGACTASTTGCIIDLDTNDNNITLNTGATSFSISGTGTRTLNCGSGTLTLSASNAGFTFATGTNATINCTSWNVAFTAVNGNADRTFANSGGTDWGNLTVASRTGNYSRMVTFTGGTAWSSCTYGSGLTILWQNSQTCTTFSMQGTSTHPVLFMTTIAGSTANVTHTTADFDWVAMRDINWLSAMTCNNCFDLGNNPNVSFNISSGSGGGFVFGG